eukprot:SAG11_NODE_14703_length_602_cov_1.721670_1_plen_121_part_01
MQLIEIERRGRKLMLQVDGAHMRVFSLSADQRNNTPLTEFGRPDAEVKNLVAQAYADTAVVCYNRAGQNMIECWNWRAAQSTWSRALDDDIAQLIELGSGSIAAGTGSGDVGVWSATGEEV